jgi:hypothetical protein
MRIYLYPLNSLDDLEAALRPDCKQVTLFDVSPRGGQQPVLTQVDGSDALAVVRYEDYFFLTNYALLYEIDEAAPCKSTSK